tara:strand:- start:21096 stop:21380 length:285 start_codon:yes stop_codon:yes gene_type:complete
MSIDNATPEDWNKAALNYDNVNRPEHYNKGKIECIDAIEAMLSPIEFVGYLRGNSQKYRWRMPYKGKALQDLKKAEWYDNRLTDYIEKNPNVVE